MWLKGCDCPTVLLRQVSASGTHIAMFCAQFTANSAVPKDKKINNFLVRSNAVER